MPMPTRPLCAVLLLLAALLALAGCGSAPDAPNADAPVAGTPVADTPATGAATGADDAVVDAAVADTSAKRPPHDAYAPADSTGAPEALAVKDAPAKRAVPAKALAEIRAGVPVRGVLDGTDPRLDDGTRYDGWVYRGAAGQVLDVRLASTAFDAYLILARSDGGKLRVLARDDDGGGGTNARLGVRLPATGTYLVLANAVRPQAQGAYELSLQASGSGSASSASGGIRPLGSAGGSSGSTSGGGGTAGEGRGLGRLTLGQPVRGALTPGDARLDDGSLADAFAFAGQAGQTLQIDAQSTDFDAFVGLLLTQTADGQQAALVARDDDGGDGRNARLRVTLPRTATYAVYVNSYRAGGQGAYTLLVQDLGGRAPAPSRPAPETASTGGTPGGSPGGTSGGTSGGTPGSTSGGMSGSATGATAGGAFVDRLPAASGLDYAARYPGGGDPGGRYALLVGIDDYPGSDNDLPSSVADVALMKQALVRDYGFAERDIVTLTDADATREHVLQAFARHLTQAGPSGGAVFFFSGHGMQLGNNVGLTGADDPEDDGRDEAIAVWGQGQGGIILDDELGVLVQQLRTERALIVLDACHSGTGTRGDAGGDADHPAKVVTWSADAFPLPDTYVDARPPDAAAADAPAAKGAADGTTSGPGNSTRDGGGATDIVYGPRNHVLLAAAAANEVALASGQGWPTPQGGRVGGSVFTYFLTQAMGEMGPSASIEALMQRVRERTVNYSRGRTGRAQTPQLEGRAGRQPLGGLLGAGR